MLLVTAPYLYARKGNQHPDVGLLPVLGLGKVDVGSENDHGIRVAPLHHRFAGIERFDEFLKVLGATYTLRKRIRAREEGSQYEN